MALKFLSRSNLKRIKYDFHYLFSFHLALPLFLDFCMVGLTKLGTLICVCVCMGVLFFWFSFCFLKDDESLRKWKEQLLGNVDLSAVGGIFSFSLSLHYLGLLEDSIAWKVISHNSW